MCLPDGSCAYLSANSYDRIENLEVVKGIELSAVAFVKILLFSLPVFSSNVRAGTST